MSQRPHVQTPRNFLYMLTVAVARSFSDDREISLRVTLCIVLPVLWMMLYLPIIGQAKATAGGGTTAPGTKSDVSTIALLKILHGQSKFNGKQLRRKKT